MVVQWTEHGLLSGLEVGSVPDGVIISEAWHWLNLPRSGGRPANREMAAEATYLIRFPNPSSFREFFEIDEGKDSSFNDGVERAGFRLPAFYHDRFRAADDRPITVVGFGPPQSAAVLAAHVAKGIFIMDAAGAPLHPGLRLCPTNTIVRKVPERDPVQRVVAIVDTDIAWAHWRFRRSIDMTRIAYFWDMDADCIADQNLAVGREMFGSFVLADYDRSIDGFLAGHYTDGSVDEMEIYRAYQAWAYDDLSRVRAVRAAGHGTHVLDCAAGAEPGPGWPVPGCEDTTPILAVQLPRLPVEETHGTYLSSYVQLALDRIEYVARAMFGRDVEIVANYSFGGSAGRHDGKSQLEQDFAERLFTGSLAALGLSAGNSFESNAHARVPGRHMRGEGVELTLRIPPDDGTPNMVELWLPEHVPSTAVTVIVTPPVGGSVSSADAVAAPTEAFVFELAAAAAGTGGGASDSPVDARFFRQIDQWPPGNSPRVKFTLVVRHTGEAYHVPGFGAGNPQLAGDWMLRLRSEDLANDAEVMIWVERDDQLPGARVRALQSYLVPKGGDRPFVFQDGTISDIATGELTSVIAGYRRSDGEPATYSSAGFQPSGGNARVPTVAAPSEEAPALPGINAAGTFSGSTRRLRGTSAATGLATRRTMLLALPGPGARPPLQNVATAEEPTFPPGVDPLRFGAGRIRAAIPGKPPRRTS